MPIEELQTSLWNQGQLFAKVIQGKEKKGIKLKDYFNYSQTPESISPHHALMLLQGRKEGYLRLSFKLTEENFENLSKPEKAALDKALFSRLRKVAEKEALALCVQNLRKKLLTPPVGKKIIMSFDTLTRHDIKVAIIDSEGKLLDTTHLFLYPPLKSWYPSLAELAKLAIRHHVEMIALGSGHGFRESFRLIKELMNMYPDLALTKQIMHTTGTPPYVAAEQIEEAFWMAVSIGRQLQNPLNELTKIDLTTLNLGNYQQDVRPEILKPAIETLIQECLHPTPSNHKPSSPAKKVASSEKIVFNSAMADAFAKLKRGET